MPIYFLEEIEAPAKAYDGSIIRSSGKYNIREAFNMTIFYTANSLNCAEHIVELLNLHSNPEYITGDLQQLSILIRRYLEDWIQNNPDGLYEDGINYVLGKILRLSKGKCLNLNFIVDLIKYDDIPWKKYKGFIPC